MLSIIFFFLDRYEATILVACYFIYAIFMSFDAKLEAFFVKRFSFLQDRVDYPEGMFPAQATTQDASAPVPTTISTKEFDSAPQGKPHCWKGAESRCHLFWQPSVSLGR